MVKAKNKSAKKTNDLKGLKKADIARKLGVADSTISGYIKRKIMPDKPEYNLQDLEDLVAARAKMQASGPQKTKDVEDYNKAEFERKLGLPNGSLYYHIKAGNIEKKERYTQQDFEDVKEKGIIKPKYKKKGPKKVKEKKILSVEAALEKNLTVKPYSAKQALNENFNPFELIKNNHAPEVREAWITKLISALKQHKVGDAPIKVPANIYLTEGATETFINEVRKRMKLEPDFESAVWRANYHVNDAEVFIHATLHRKS